MLWLVERLSGIEGSSVCHQEGDRSNRNCLLSYGRFFRRMIALLQLDAGKVGDSDEDHSIGKLNHDNDKKADK